MEQQLNLFGEKVDYIVRKNEKNVLPLHNPNDTKKMSSQGKVVKKYKDVPPPTVDFIKFGNDFVDEFLLGKESTKLSINSLKIVFNIISQLRKEQFQQKNQPQQLSLFEEEFSKRRNSFAEIRIKNSLITRDSKLLKKAYEFLENYKKGWYYFTTLEGKKVEAYGGLISNIFHQESGYTYFEISSYWMKRLLQIDSYNKTLYKLVYNIRSNKHILFFFWLSKLPMEGTLVKLSTLNSYFDVNYSTARDLCKDFLRAIRNNLDKYSHKSFNYNYLGELITIKPYLTQYVEAEATNTEEAKKDIKGNYKLRYYKDRHQLTDEQLKGIKFIYERCKDKIDILTFAYELFIEECRKKKKKATEYTGLDFLEKFQIYIEETYQIKNAKHFTKYSKLVPEKCYLNVVP